MTVNTNPSSRRALLAAAAGGTVALVAESLARPLPARAEGPYVVLGGPNEAKSTTTLNFWDGPDPVLTCSSDKGPAIEAYSVTEPAIKAVSDTEVAISAVSKQHIGIIGWGGEPHVRDLRTNLTGVSGRSYAGVGVAGMSQTGGGVHAESETGSGVYARSTTGFGVDAFSDSGIAVRAVCPGGTAVDARTGAADPFVAAVKGAHEEGDAVVGLSKTTTGVRGIGEDAASGVTGESVAVGVEGRTTGTTTEEDMFGADVVAVRARVEGPGGFGIGVRADGASGVGVLGQGGHCGVHGHSDKAGVEGKSLPGTGVSGQTNDGIAVHAGVFPGGSGFALRTDGPVVFSTAGTGNLVGGKAKVTPGVALDGASKVLIALMGSPGAQAQVPYVVVTPGPAGTGFFRVLVPGARGTVPFAYFVIS